MKKFYEAELLGICRLMIQLLQRLKTLDMMPIVFNDEITNFLKKSGLETRKLMVENI